MTTLGELRFLYNYWLKDLFAFIHVHPIRTFRCDFLFIVFSADIFSPLCFYCTVFVQVHSNMRARLISRSDFAWHSESGDEL